MPTTFLLTSFYWDNFIFFGLGPEARRGRRAGAHAIRWATRSCPGSPPRTSASARYGIFKAGDEFVGKTVGIAGEHLTGAEMAAAFTRALGEEVRYNDVPADVYRSFGFPGADDLGNMFQFKRDFNDAYSAARSLELSRRLNPDLQTFDRWLAENAGRIPLG